MCPITVPPLLRAHGAKPFVLHLPSALQAGKKSKQLFAVNCWLQQSHFRAVSLLHKQSEEMHAQTA